jgi:EAL and modified HD-GYP domain-containing signal transduction protein
MINLYRGNIMRSSTFLSRQPILNSDEHTVFYDLFYLDKNLGSDFIDDRYASTSVLSSVLNKFGVKSIVGNHSAFIKADDKFLLHDLIFSIPKEYFIISILEQVEISPAILKRLQMLKDKGYRLCLNDIALTTDMVDKFKDILPYMDYIKVDMLRTGIILVEQNLHLIEKFPAQKIAAKLETAKDFSFSVQNGFDFFQGYYFAKPVILNNATLDVAQLSVLRLTSKLMSDETSIEDIVEEFEQNYALTIQLLKFINSGAFHFREKLSSIKHILTLLGRQKLSQWLMLMIYAKSIVNNPSMESPLLLMVKNRTELMVKLLHAIDSDVSMDLESEAYFVAVLSLSDTLFSVSKTIILNELNVSQEVRDAILKKEGLLGEIYALICDIEEIRTKNIQAFIEKHKLQSDTISKIVSESMSNVNELEASLRDDAMISY